MFSGIVKAVGKVQAVEQMGSTKRVRIASSLADSVSIDQSVLHDGVCLTIVAAGTEDHTVDIVQETLSKTTLQFVAPGDMINLEKAITLSTLLDGHIVQGHVDTILQCVRKTDLDGSWLFAFELPAAFSALVILHGSICLNGVSLTVARLYDNSFEVAVIPYTYDHTNFHSVHAGDYVNVEFDMIGKYIRRQSQA